EPHPAGVTDGPEYECVVSLGSNLLVDDLKAVAYFDLLCDSMGVDVLTAGAVIGFATYLYRQGLITQAETGGIPLAWNNPEQVITLLNQIARRQKFGDSLANGIRYMEQRFNAPGLGVQFTGMDPGMHDPRGFGGMALVYLTSPRGGCHNKSDFYFVEAGHTFDALGISSDDHRQEAGKAPLVAKHQDYRTLVDASGCCAFVNVHLDVLPKMFTAAWGTETTLEELMLAGERIFTLKRLLNLKLGLNPRRDEVMPQLLDTPLAEGPAAGYVPNWRLMLKEYYRYRDWDWETGIPSPGKLAELGLTDLVGQPA
ncbi:MAG: aldehyde ferredoxin oxidoreductase C-terminal domain-containing protein, partial [Anaerolineae bacterium]